MTIGNDPKNGTFETLRRSKCRNRAADTIINTFPISIQQLKDKMFAMLALMKGREIEQLLPMKN